MRRSLTIVALAAVASGAVVAAIYGLHGGIDTALLLTGVGLVGLAAAHLAAVRRRRMRLRRQFALTVALVVGCILIATVVGALLMFVSDHDAVMVSVITVFAGVLAVRAAGLLSSGVLDDVRTIRDGLMHVGEGRREVRLDVSGRDELTELAGQVNSMVARLDAEERRAAAADTARRDLVAAASHDLRTPVSALRLLVEALDDELVDETTRRRYQRTMQTNIQALGALIDDLFELSRIEAGDITWSMQQVRLPKLVDETVEAMRGAARAKGVALSTELRDCDVRARADPEKLQRVLFNLIQNAIRHTPADGSVTVRAIALHGEAEIEVADTGSGVASAERGRVFEPFYRGGADAVRHTDGAGLGLAISRAIVEAHGGRIWLESAGAGTSVRFTLRVA
jgi:signal transduction histidine kinase